MSNPANSPAPPRKPRLPIAAAIALFVLTAAILYYRWATMTEPSCVIVVQTSLAWKDATIRVDGPTLIKGSLTATVGQGGRYSIPFFLDPGAYTIDVMIDDQLQYHASTELRRNQMATFDLSTRRPTNAGTTLPSPSPF